MRKTPENHGKEWSKSDLLDLKNLAKGNTPTGLIANNLGRTEDAIRSIASKENISLKPTNQSPYDRKFSNANKFGK